MTNLPVNINGRILQEDQNGIHTSNRSYLYGDGVFETIRVFKGKVINFENHFHRLKEGSLAIYIDFPKNFTVPFFLEKIEEILMKSSLFLSHFSVHIIITLFLCNIFVSDFQCITI